MDDYQRDRISDLNYSIGRLRLSDCWDFATSVTIPQDRGTALVGCLFKGLVLRTDLCAFLASPKQRLKAARDQMEHGLYWNDGYPGNAVNLLGLSADLERREIHFLRGLDADRAQTRSALRPFRTFTPTQARLRGTDSLGWGVFSISTATHQPELSFCNPPRSPLRIPDRRVPPRFIQSIASRPRISILHEDKFQDLEQPDMFGDGLPLNKDGRENSP